MPTSTPLPPFPHPVLITGTAGFLGWNMARHARSLGCSIIAAVHRTPVPDTLADEVLPLDLASEALQLPSRPLSAVIHCAAMAGVAECEAHPALAMRVNAEAVGRLAGDAAARNIPFVTISTDLVFDGTRGWYTEADAPNPVTRYAETKLRGEEEARRRGDPWIIRTALMYGRHADRPGSFVRWTLDGLRERRMLTLYRNQYRTPLDARDACALAFSLIAREAPRGVYHAGGPDRVSRLALGRMLADVFELDASYIVESDLHRSSVPGDVDDTSLNTEKAHRATGVMWTALREGLLDLRHALPPGPGSTGPAHC